MAGKPPTADDTPGDRSPRLMRLATYASVSVAGTLVVTKAGAWLMTDSVAVLSSLLDSFLDVLASLVNLFAVRHALTPADREHRFGHGKAEALAALGQAAFISGSAVLLVFEAIRRLVDPREVTNEPVGIGVMAFSILLTLALVLYQSYVVRRTRSVAISADSLHYRGDLLVNGGVIVSLVLSMTLGWVFVDPIFAIGVAVYILWNAWQIVRQGLNILMDRELPEDERARIHDIALSHPEVRAMHDLRSRRSGTMTFIQLHLELDGGMSLAHAHDIADAVEDKIREAFPGAEVIIHQDPEGVIERRATFA